MTLVLLLCYYHFHLMHVVSIYFPTVCCLWGVVCFSSCVSVVLDISIGEGRMVYELRERE